jgi:hypothetical protein
VKFEARIVETGRSANMSTAQCTIFLGESTSALSQIFTGFALLRRRGLLDVKLRKTKGNWLGLGGAAVSARVGDHQIVYDMRDQPRTNPDAIEWSTHYFKRSFQRGWVTGVGSEKVLPLGFSYAVYACDDWRFQRMVAAVLCGSASIKVAGRAIVDLSETLSRLAQRPAGRHACQLDLTESSPSTHETPRVLLLTRTWDPASVSHDPSLADAWSAMNRMRVECIRALRMEFGEALIGGLAATQDAIRDYPDCVVLDPHVTRKLHYLELMRESDVCIATRGLAGSNGWRLGEYVAASRAVVSEVLECEVPGGFAPGRNYMAFTDPGSCVEQTLALMNDSDRRRSMMEANQAYYQAYLRPDAVVLNSLLTAGAMRPTQ